MPGSEDRPIDLPPDVSRETRARLEAFLDLVMQWNRTINLIGPGTRDDAWRRHVVDSAQLLALAPERVGHWVDLGSGGGFPGLVLAMMAQDTRPRARFALVESDRRKASFLAMAAERFAPGAQVRAVRAEEVPGLAADVVSARALAPLDSLLGLVRKHLAPGGIAILPKGRNAAAELAQARERWSVTADLLPSLTDAEARIVTARNIAPIAG